MDSCSNNENFSFPTPVPAGMGRLLIKLENAQKRSYPVGDATVTEEFSMTDANVSFTEPKCDNFRLLYGRICTTKQNLKEWFCDKYPEKLPKDRICREELIRDWGSLDLLFNAQDILGCILPNDPKQFALINAWRFIQQPILHWETVHLEKRVPKKTNLLNCFSANNNQFSKV